MYKISGGQLTIIWILGIVLWSIVMDMLSNQYISVGGQYIPVAGFTELQADLFLFTLVLIPLILIFYTFGWRNHKNKAKGN